MPQYRCEDGSWPHPLRLPLGGGWNGYCTAPGHEGEVPELAVLQDGCNLGYANSCSRRPWDRTWDSVRFQVSRSGEKRLLLAYVCERDHRPGAYGTLEYDLTVSEWVISHDDQRIQQMARCYVDSYLLRQSNTPAPEQ